MRINLTDWLLLILLSVVWGGSFFFASVAVHQIPPMTVVWCRVAIAAITLWMIVRAMGLSMPRSREAWRMFMFMGVINNVIPFSLLFWAQTHIASGLASILNATTPIFAILVAHFLLADEGMARNKVIGVILGLAGVVILVGADALKGADLGTLGIIACLGAALSYGFSVVYGRRFRVMGYAPAVGACGQITSSTIIVFPIMMLLDQPWTLPVPETNAVLSILGLGIVCTGFAYVIYFRLIGTAGAVNTALVTLLVPVSAILLGAVFLNETLAPQEFFGMALIGAGLLAVDGRVLCWWK